MAEPAPLLSVPLAPVPWGGAAEWVEGEGGVRLRAALFPVAGPKGSVVLSPGRSEPLEKYYEVVEELRGRGFTVLAHDWRGHGLSQRLARDPLRGHASRLDAYVEDQRRLLAAFETRLPRPWIALGHSMGGALNAVAVSEGAVDYDALAVTAPMLALDLRGRPAWFARALSWTLSRSFAAQAYAAGAGDPLGGRFEDNVLTHDQRRWARTRALLEAHPQLQLGHVTWGWLAMALEVSRRMAGRRLDLPLALVAAGDDRLVDNRAARALAERSESATYVEIPGAYHEILMEKDYIRATFWAAFDVLIARATASPPA